MLQKDEMGAFLRRAAMHQRTPSTKMALPARKPPPMPWAKKKQAPPVRPASASATPTKVRAYAYDESSKRWTLQEVEANAADESDAAAKASEDEAAKKAAEERAEAKAKTRRTRKARTPMGVGTKQQKQKPPPGEGESCSEYHATSPVMAASEPPSADDPAASRSEPTIRFQQEPMGGEDGDEAYFTTYDAGGEVDQWVAALQSWQAACAMQLEDRVQMQLHPSASANPSAAGQRSPSPERSCATGPAIMPSMSYLAAAAVLNPPPQSSATPCKGGATRKAAGKAVGKAAGKYDGKGGVFLRPASFDKFFRPSTTTSSRVAMGQSRSVASLAGAGPSMGQLSMASTQASELRPRAIQFGGVPQNVVVARNEAAAALAAIRLAEAGYPGSDLRTWEYRAPPERRQAGEPGGSLQAHIPFWQRTMPPPGRNTRSNVALTKPKRVLMYGGGGQQIERLIWPEGH